MDLCTNLGPRALLVERIRKAAMGKIPKNVLKTRKLRQDDSNKMCL